MCEELQNQPNLTGPHQWVLISTNCDDFHAFQHVFGSIYNVLGSKKAALKVSIPLGSFGALSNRSIRVTSCRFSVRKRPKQCEVGILGTTTAIPPNQTYTKNFCVHCSSSPQLKFDILSPNQRRPPPHNNAVARK